MLIRVQTVYNMTVKILLQYTGRTFRLQLLLVCCSYWFCGLLKEERYSQAVKNLEFDRQLGPYALSHLADWKRLSNYITKSTIERIEPIGGEISVAYESGINESIPRTAMEESLIEQLKGSTISASTVEPQKRSYYTSVPRVIKKKGICGEELTSLNLDKTHLLESILMKDYGGEEDLLLAELQFAFIAFLMGQSLEAFLQWKALISLLLSCTEAFMAFPFRNDLDKYWPDLFGNNISFWNHEWEKHGWCHYSKAEQYFGETIRLVKEVETNLGSSLISVFIAAGLNPGSRSYDPGLFSKQIYTISKIVTEVRCKYGPNNRAQVNEIVFCVIQTAGSNTYHLHNCSSPARGTNWSNCPYSQNCQVLPRGTLFPK